MHVKQKYEYQKNSHKNADYFSLGLYFKNPQTTLKIWRTELIMEK